MHVSPEITKPSCPFETKWFQDGPQGRFLCLPILAVKDRRLKLESIRVLMALAMHADVSGRCFPSRRLLSELTGIHPTNVSKATSALVKFGWLSKRQRTGRSAVYHLKTPDSLTTEPDFQDLDAFLRAHGIDTV